MYVCMYTATYIYMIEFSFINGWSKIFWNGRLCAFEAIYVPHYMP